MRTRLRRRHEDAVRLVHQTGVLLMIRAEDADEAVQLVVVRLDVVVRDRPVVAESVEALSPEIRWTEAQRNAAPVMRAAAEHPPAEPSPRALADRVRLAVDVPPA